jgi:hypothetical protein
MFLQFTVIVNIMRANVAMLPYDDHERAIKILHSLDHTVWSEKVEAILESEKYETLTVNELVFQAQVIRGGPWGACKDREPD